VITLLLVGLFSVMGMTMINLASSDYQVATNESRSIQALFNADAGTEEAKMRISPNAPSGMQMPIGTAANWRAYILSGRTQAQIQTGLDPEYGLAAPNYTTTESTSNYFYYNTVQTGPNAIQWGWARIQHVIDGSGNILYQDVTTGQATTAATQILSGTTVYNPPILTVTAEGIQGSVRRMITPQLHPIVSTITTTTDYVTNPFADAMHGRGNITLSGNAYTDSYDSRNGAYNVNGNRDSHGDASSDSTAPGTFSLNGNATINGSAEIGPGGNTSTGFVLTGNAMITGGKTNESAAWNLPLSTIPNSVTNQGPLSISGNRTVTLGTGTYWFSSISISGNGRLVTTGPVVIFVTGNMSISGNGISTAGNLPPNLLLYGAQGCNSISISGNGDFYGAVYAPAASVSVSGNGRTFGAVTGNTVSYSGNGGFHYDKALGNLGQIVTTSTGTTYTTTGYTRYSWREIAF
jgi:hypothetical protein